MSVFSALLLAGVASVLALSYPLLRELVAARRRGQAVARTGKAFR